MLVLYSTYDIDTKAPIIVGVSLSNYIMRYGDIVTAYIEFDEDIYLNGVSNIIRLSDNLSFDGATSSSVAILAKNITFNFRVDDNVASKNNITLSVLRDSIQDYYNNTYLADNSTLINVRLDTLLPYVSNIAFNDTDIKFNDTISANITFSEPISGFKSSDFTINNATNYNYLNTSSAAFAFSQSSYSKVWQINFTIINGVEDNNSNNDMVALDFNIDTSALNDTINNSFANSSYTQNSILQIDTKHPQVLNITFNQTVLGYQQVARVVFTFSEEVLSLTDNDVNITLGNLTNITATNDLRVYEGIFTPPPGISAITTANVTVKGYPYPTTIIDDRGNYLIDEYIQSISVEIDTIPPAFTNIISNVDYLKRGESANITLVFSEAVQGLTIGDIDSTYGVVSDLSTDAQSFATKGLWMGFSRWYVKFTPFDNITGDDLDDNITINITVSGTSQTYDAAGNRLLYGSNDTILHIDTVSPNITSMRFLNDANTATRTMSEHLIKGHNTTFEIVFSEYVSGVDASNIEISNPTANAYGQVSNLAPINSNFNNHIWRGVFTPNDNISYASWMNMSVTYQPNTIIDNASNDYIANESTNLSISIDTMLPMVNITLSPLGLINYAIARDNLRTNPNSALRFNFAISEDANAFDIDSTNFIVQTNAGYLGLATSKSVVNTTNASHHWAVYGFPLVANIDEVNELINITLINTTLVDKRGNHLLANVDMSFVIDTISPFITNITANTTVIKRNDRANVTFIFNKNITGINLAQINATSGMIVDLKSKSGLLEDSEWSVVYIPYNDTEANEWDITINTTGIIDSFNNTVSQTIQTQSYINGTNGLGSARLVRIDTLLPYVSNIAFNDTDIKFNDTISANITFSEPISGFKSSDFTINNATNYNYLNTSSAAFAFSQSSYSKVWQINFTIINGVEDNNSNNDMVALDFNIDTSALNDTINNSFANSSYTQNSILQIDTKHPQVLNITFNQTVLGYQQVARVVFTFSEEVLSLTDNDVNITLGNLTNITATNDLRVYEGIFTPPPGISAITIANVTVKGYPYPTTIIDDRGNYLIDEYIQSISVEIDTIPPAFTNIISNVDYLKRGESANITLVFSEAVWGLTIGDINSTYGVVSDLSTDAQSFTVKGLWMGFSRWYVKFTPFDNITGDDLDDNITINITVSGTSQTYDAAGNRLLYGSNDTILHIDTVSPNITSMRFLNDANTATRTMSEHLIKGHNTTFEIVFSEYVSGVDASNIEISNPTANAYGQVSNLAPINSNFNNHIWRGVFTPNDNISYASWMNMSVTYQPNTIIDNASNDYIANESTNLSISIDTMLPEILNITITPIDGSVIRVDVDNTSYKENMANISVTFNEVGITLNGLIFNMPHLNTFTWTDSALVRKTKKVWTGVVTADNNIEFDNLTITFAPNGSFNDSRGNIQTMSNVVSNSYSIDTLSPHITSMTVTPMGNYSRYRYPNVTITFSEPVVDFDILSILNTKINVTNGTFITNTSEQMYGLTNNKINDTTYIVQFIPAYGIPGNWQMTTIVFDIAQNIPQIIDNGSNMLVSNATSSSYSVNLDIDTVAPHLLNSLIIDNHGATLNLESNQLAFVTFKLNEPLFGTLKAKHINISNGSIVPGTLTWSSSTEFRGMFQPDVGIEGDDFDNNITINASLILSQLIADNITDTYHTPFNDTVYVSNITQIDTVRPYVLDMNVSNQFITLANRESIMSMRFNERVRQLNIIDVASSTNPSFNITANGMLIPFDNISLFTNSSNNNTAVTTLSNYVFNANNKIVTTFINTTIDLVLDNVNISTLLNDFTDEAGNFPNVTFGLNQPFRVATVPTKVLSIDVVQSDNTNLIDSNMVLNRYNNATITITFSDNVIGVSSDSLKIEDINGMPSLGKCVNMTAVGQGVNINTTWQCTYIPADNITGEANNVIQNTTLVITVLTANATSTNTTNVPTDAFGVFVVPSAKSSKTIIPYIDTVLPNITAVYLTKDTSSNAIPTVFKYDELGHQLVTIFSENVEFGNNALDIMAFNDSKYNTPLKGSSFVRGSTPSVAQYVYEGSKATQDAFIIREGIQTNDINADYNLSFEYFTTITDKAGNKLFVRDASLRAAYTTPADDVANNKYFLSLYDNNTWGRVVQVDTQRVIATNATISDIPVIKGQPVNVILNFNENVVFPATSTATAPVITYETNSTDGFRQELSNGVIAWSSLSDTSVSDTTSIITRLGSGNDNNYAYNITFMPNQNITGKYGNTTFKFTMHYNESAYDTITDRVGNEFFPNSTNVSDLVYIDTVEPELLSIAVENTSLFANETIIRDLNISFLAVFSERVINLTEDNFNATNYGTFINATALPMLAPNASSANTNQTWRIFWRAPYGEDGDSNPSNNIPDNKTTAITWAIENNGPAFATDRAGNNLTTIATFVDNHKIDTILPELVSVTFASTSINGENASSVVNIQFSEPVRNLEATDFNVSNGEFIHLQPIPSGAKITKAYTAIFVPYDNISQSNLALNVSIYPYQNNTVINSLDYGVKDNYGNNINTTKLITSSLTIDNQRFEITSSSVSAGGSVVGGYRVIKANEEITLVLNFNKNLGNDFSASDISFNIPGSVSIVTGGSGTKRATLKFAPNYPGDGQENIVNLTYTITPKSSVLDSDGNHVSYYEDTIDAKIDTIAPFVTSIEFGDRENITMAGHSAQWVIRLSEPVNNFTSSSVVVALTSSDPNNANPTPNSNYYTILHANQNINHQVYTAYVDFPSGVECVLGAKLTFTVSISSGVTDNIGNSLNASQQFTWSPNVDVRGPKVSGFKLVSTGSTTELTNYKFNTENGNAHGYYQAADAYITMESDDTILNTIGTSSLTSNDLNATGTFTKSTVASHDILKQSFAPLDNYYSDSISFVLDKNFAQDRFGNPLVRDYDITFRTNKKYVVGENAATTTKEVLIDTIKPTLRVKLYGNGTDDKDGFSTTYINPAFNVAMLWSKEVVKNDGSAISASDIIVAGTNCGDILTPRFTSDSAISIEGVFAMQTAGTFLGYRDNTTCKIDISGGWRDKNYNTPIIPPTNSGNSTVLYGNGTIPHVSNLRSSFAYALPTMGARGVSLQADIWANFTEPIEFGGIYVPEDEEGIKNKVDRIAYINITREANASGDMGPGRFAGGDNIYAYAIGNNSALSMSGGNKILKIVIPEANNRRFCPGGKYWVQIDTGRFVQKDSKRPVRNVAWSFETGGFNATLSTSCGCVDFGLFQAP